MGKKTLTLERLRRSNTRRCKIVYKQRLKDWSLAEWASALAEETGEVCGVTKRILRKEKTIRKNKSDLADELADVIIMADLLAAAANINLTEAVIRKFNKRSEEKNSKIKL